MNPSRLVAVAALVVVGGFAAYASGAAGRSPTVETAAIAEPGTADPATPAEPTPSAVADQRQSREVSDEDRRAEEAGPDEGDDLGGKPAPPVLGQAKELVDLDGWLQTDVSSLEEVDAPVRVVQFWTFGCYNCKNTLPHLQALYGQYRDDGLEIIGVHAPEFDFEKDVDSIQAAAKELGVTWPIALDTNKRNFRNWQEARRFWPRTYVLDSEGQIRFDHIGEGAYDELAATVAWLLENQT